MVTVGSIVGGTARFARANIGVIAVWAALYILVLVVERLAIGPFLAPALAGGDAPPASPGAAGAVAVAAFMTSVVTVILYNAVSRAVLFPDARAAAYLRLGMDELRLVGLVMLLLLGTILCVTIVSLAGWLIMRLFGSMLGVGSLGATIAGGVILAGMLFGALWVAMPLAMTVPLTLQRRRIVIGPAWQLSKGRFGRLLGAYLVCLLAQIAVAIAMTIPTMTAALSAASGEAEAADAVAAQAGLLAAPTGILPLVLYGALGIVVLVLQAGMPAIAATQLLDETAGAM